MDPFKMNDDMKVVVQPLMYGFMSTSIVRHPKYADNEIIDRIEETPRKKLTNQRIITGFLNRYMSRKTAYDICSAQPMTGPVGKIFSLKPKFSDDVD